MHTERNTLIVCAASGLGEPIGRWVEALEGSWPEWEHPPRLVVTSMDGLNDALGDRPGEFAGIVAIVHDGARAEEMWRLGALARRTNTPVLALCETVSAERAALAADGVVVRSWDAHDTSLVSTITALRDRQGLVRRLAGELTHALSINPSHRDAGDDATCRLVGAVQRAHTAGIGPTPGVEIAMPSADHAGVTPRFCTAGQLDTHLIRFALAGVGAIDARGGLTMMLAARLLEHDLHHADQVAPFHPARALRMINSRLAGTDALPMTLIYGVMDTVSGEVTIGVAGAGAVCVRADRTMERIEPTGPAVGVEANAAFGERVVNLEPGEVLALGGGPVGVRELERLGAGVRPMEALEGALEPGGPGTVLLVRWRPASREAAA